MQYQKTNILFVLALMLSSVAIGIAQQQPPKQPRPTKHPTQFDKIIDPLDKPATPPETTEKTDEAVVTTPTTGLQPSDALVQAVQSLTTEVKNLVNEVRANNARQQIQTDVLRMSRLDLRLDRYEAELKTVRDRLALLEAESQNMQMLLTSEALEAQVSRMPYANKSDALRQVKETHEARLRMVNAEKELVQKREAELSGVVKGFREASNETEKRLQAIEESLKKLNESSREDLADKPKSDPPEDPQQL